jgi:hypothetical protein
MNYCDSSSGDEDVKQVIKKNPYSDSESESSDEQRRAIKIETASKKRASSSTVDTVKSVEMTTRSPSPSGTAKVNVLVNAQLI